MQHRSRTRRLRVREHSLPTPRTPGHLLRAALALALAAMAVAVLGGRAHAAAVTASTLTAAPQLKLPEFIGVLDYLGERTRADQRAGASYAYRAAGLSLDVDVYDDAAAVPAPYESAKRAVAALPRLAGAQLLEEATRPLGSERTLSAREAVFRVHSAQFEGTSYLWVAAVGGRLLQMRLDVQRGFEDDGQVSRGEVLAAIGDALAHPAEQSGEERQAARANARLNVAILWDPLTPERERELWTVYLFTRAAQAAKESEDHVLPPGERAASFEEEVRARRMAVNVFRKLAQQDPPLRSRYFSDLDRVETAGYLREYVWRYLNSPAWSEPQGLNLTAFDAWRAHNLARHHAVTHGRIALRLAAN
jgi:hypothetical protein